MSVSRPPADILKLRIDHNAYVALPERVMGAVKQNLILSISVAKMAEPNAIAKAFVDYYYNAFDTGRSQLSPLYSEQSMLTFEGDQILGTSSIIRKLIELPFQKVQHKINTLDAQPLPAGLCILVTGTLFVDDSEQPINFSQMFSLVPSGESYVVQNDIFRLNYG